MTYLQKNDPDVYRVLEGEKKRQREGIELIPSENYVSAEVLEGMGSIFTNKYSEGYPGKRYYGGQEFTDQIENIAIDRAKKLFNVPHANVQPYSGSPANFAVYVATCELGDPIMGLYLFDGGHLTHGWKVSVTGKFYKSIPYHITPEGNFDYDAIHKLAVENKPKLIWAGATAYMKKYEYDKFAQIADDVGAYFAADIAHVAGLIIGGVHPDPVPYAHVITTTTHKTLRGPRGGMIMVTEKGLQKDPDLATKIDKAVFPGLQGGPHDHQTCGIAIALGEAMKPEFKTYAAQIVKNAYVLAEELKKYGFKLIGNGTENHLILVDLQNKNISGKEAEAALDKVGITVNKNTIPNEPKSPFDPSGIRLGTPAITTRGMKEDEMKQVAAWMSDAIEHHMDESHLRKLKEQVKTLCLKFPVPGMD